MEITLNGKTYRIERLNALNQAYVFKRLSPLAIAVLGTLSNISRFVKVSPSDPAENQDENTAREVKVEMDYAALGTPVMEAFSRMPDEDVEFILRTCLEKVLWIKNEREAHRIMVNGQLMYEDSLLIDLMYLTWLVVRDDLQNFTSGIVTLLAAQ